MTPPPKLEVDMTVEDEELSVSRSQPLVRGGSAATPAAEPAGARFTLDTSGAVYIPRGDLAGTGAWRHLSPFVQGYVEAMFADERHHEDGWSLARRGWAFSDLAPETLARIMKDCASKTTGSLGEPTGYEGMRFWQRRQAGEDVYFPPLAPYLGDDGKVRFQDTSEGSTGPGEE